MTAWTSPETGAGRFQNAVSVDGRHHLLADEPTAAGGLGSGPSPYDYLAIALGACTSMTLRIYAEHKKLALPPVTVRVDHGKVPVEHCEDCGNAVEGRTGKIDRFERSIGVAGRPDPALAEKLIEIANKCPVHRTLEAGAAIKAVDAATLEFKLARLAGDEARLRSMGEAARRIATPNAAADVVALISQTS